MIKVEQFNYFFAQNIQLSVIGSPLIELHEVESTNNYAMGMVHAGMTQHGTAVFTTRQTKGKGQREKQWVSEPGKNMALSIIVQPHGLSFSQLFLLSMMSAVSVYDVFAASAGEETKIKWPNDIYWRDRKAAGILIENVVQANEWKFSIIGVGCNVNQVEFGDMQQRAVSLKQITGKEFDPKDVATEICSRLNDNWQQLYSAPQKVASEYRNKLYKLNERVKLKQSTRVFEAVIRGVTTDGQLVVYHSLEEKFHVGEVEWII